MKKGNKLLNTITVNRINAGESTLYASDVETLPTSPGSTRYYSISLRNLRNYIPFRAMHVVNKNVTSSAEIKFDYQNDRNITCLSNGIKDIKDQPFSSFSIKNTGSIDLIPGDVIIELETY